jgi:hypothetical protein
VVKWSAELTRTKPNAPSAKLSATIMEGWHVYALSQPDGGPTPLKISIPSGSPLVLAGPIAETKVVRHFDPSFQYGNPLLLQDRDLQSCIEERGSGPRRDTFH